MITVATTTPICLCRRFAVPHFHRVAKSARKVNIVSAARLRRVQGATSPGALVRVSSNDLVVGLHECADVGLQYQGSGNKIFTLLV